MTDPAKPGVLQFERGGNLLLWRISRKLQHLRAICHSLCVAMMPREGTAGIDFHNVVGFASVAIPRLIFRGKGGQKFVLLAFAITSW